jgi:hypothetical protein
MMKALQIAAGVWSFLVSVVDELPESFLDDLWSTLVDDD